MHQAVVNNHGAAISRVEDLAEAAHAWDAR